MVVGTRIETVVSGDVTHEEITQADRVTVQSVKAALTEVVNTIISNNQNNPEGLKRDFRSAIDAFLALKESNGGLDKLGQILGDEPVFSKDGLVGFRAILRGEVGQIAHQRMYQNIINTYATFQPEAPTDFIGTLLNAALVAGGRNALSTNGAQTKAVYSTPDSLSQNHLPPAMRESMLLQLGIGEAFVHWFINKDIKPVIRQVAGAYQLDGFNFDISAFHRALSNVLPDEIKLDNEFNIVKKVVLVQGTGSNQLRGYYDHKTPLSRLICEDELAASVNLMLPADHPPVTSKHMGIFIKSLTSGTQAQTAESVAAARPITNEVEGGATTETRLPSNRRIKFGSNFDKRIRFGQVSPRAVRSSTGSREEAERHPTGGVEGGSVDSSTHADSAWKRGMKVIIGFMGRLLRPAAAAASVLAATAALPTLAPAATAGETLLGTSAIGLATVVALALFRRFGVEDVKSFWETTKNIIKGDWHSIGLAAFPIAIPVAVAGLAAGLTGAPLAMTTLFGALLLSTAGYFCFYSAVPKRTASAIEGLASGDVTLWLSNFEKELKAGTPLDQISLAKIGFDPRAKDIRTRLKELNVPVANAGLKAGALIGSLAAFFAVGPLADVAVLNHPVLFTLGVVACTGLFEVYGWVVGNKTLADKVGGKGKKIMEALAKGFHSTSSTLSEYEDEYQKQVMSILKSKRLDGSGNLGLHQGAKPIFELFAQIPGFKDKAK